MISYQLEEVNLLLHSSKMEIANFPMNVFELCMISLKVAWKFDDNDAGLIAKTHTKKTPGMPLKA